MLPLPSREHVAPDRLAGQIRALDVEREDRVEPLLGEVLGGAAKCRARAVDQDVHRPELRDGALGHRLDRPAVGHVAVHRDRATALCVDRRRGRSGSVVVDVDDHDGRTRLRKALGDRRTDPAASARHAGDTAAEAEEPGDEPGRDLEAIVGACAGWFWCAHALSSIGNGASCSSAASAALTPATTSATWGSTSRSSTAANGIGVSFAVTRTGRERRRCQAASETRATTSLAKPPARAPSLTTTSLPRLLDRADDRVEVERLQRAEIDDLDLDALAGQLTPGLEGELDASRRRRRPSRPCPRASSPATPIGTVYSPSGTGPRRL